MKTTHCPGWPRACTGSPCTAPVAARTMRLAPPPHPHTVRTLRETAEMWDTNVLGGIAAELALIINVGQERGW